MTPAGLKRTADETLPLPSDAFTRTITTALLFLELVFGKPWSERHIYSSRKDGFLYGACDPNLSQLSIQRVIDLAEMIFNFQFVSLIGLDEVLDKIDAGDIEPAFAELDTAKLLIRFGVTFGFHKATGIKGTSYDFDACLQNRAKACIETECKMSGQEPTEKKIRETLSHARKQLPAASAQLPCVILLKTPQVWLASRPSWNIVNSAVNRFLGGAPKVTSIVFYSERTIPGDKGPRDGFRVFERENTRHQFDKTESWRLLPAFAPKDMDTRWFSFWNLYSQLKITGKTTFEGFGDTT